MRQVGVPKTRKVFDNFTQILSEICFFKGYITTHFEKLSVITSRSWYSRGLFDNGSTMSQAITSQRWSLTTDYTEPRCFSSLGFPSGRLGSCKHTFKWRLPNEDRHVKTQLTTFSRDCPEARLLTSYIASPAPFFFVPSRTHRKSQAQIRPRASAAAPVWHVIPACGCNATLSEFSPGGKHGLPSWALFTLQGARGPKLAENFGFGTGDDGKVKRCSHRRGLLASAPDTWR